MIQEKNNKIDLKQLARRVQKASMLRGEFLLRSGQTSNFYFDKYRFESDPRLLALIAEKLAPLLPQDTDLLGGLELGGVPLASALSLQTNIPAVFIRKKAKSYGTCSLAEGAKIKGKKITLIEDVITTGGQVCQSAELLRKKGAVIRHVVCVIHRSLNLKNTLIEKHNMKLKSLFTLNDFEGL